eukprot:6259578-Alexandrium_andersonii.AAC.1
MGGVAPEAPPERGRWHRGPQRELQTMHPAGPGQDLDQSKSGRPRLDTHAGSAETSPSERR